MDEVIEQFKDGFPNGAALFRHEDAPVIDMVHFDFRFDSGKWLARGKSYPNKDFYFDFSDVEETSHGWNVKTMDGEQVFIYPLTPERGAAMVRLLEDSY